MSVHLIPTPLTISRVDEIQDATECTVTAYGELIKPEPRPHSAMFDMMCDMVRGEKQFLMSEINDPTSWEPLDFGKDDE